MIPLIIILKKFIISGEKFNKEKVKIISQLTGNYHHNFGTNKMVKLFFILFKFFIIWILDQWFVAQHLGKKIRISDF